MKTTKKELQNYTLRELLQEAELRTRGADLPADQKPDIMELLLSLLQTIEYPELGLDLRDIPGLWHGKRALEVAAAGRHNLLFVGEPGIGKAALARILPSLLPIPSSSLLEPDSSMEKRGLEQSLLAQLTRAQSLVLFLKDLETFDHAVLSSLPHLIQAQVRLFPDGQTSLVHSSAIQLMATLTRPPCEDLLDIVEASLCSPKEQAEEKAQHGQSLTRVVETCFDLVIEVPRATPVVEETVSNMPPEESTATIRQRVASAHLIQSNRYAEAPHLCFNASLQGADEVAHFCPMFAPAQELLNAALRQLHLTPRQALRLQAVARTIADLADASMIAGKHMAEAIKYLPTGE